MCNQNLIIVQWEPLKSLVFFVNAGLCVGDCCAVCAEITNSGIRVKVSDLEFT